MEDNVVSQQNTNQQVQTKEPTKQDDLITRQSQVKLPEKQTQQQQTSETFNVNDINNIEDATAREYALKAYKSMEKGYQQKYQEVATTRKTFEADKQRFETEKSDFSNWSPEKVQALLSNPEFVQAAQKGRGVQNTNAEEYSGLSDTYKQTEKTNKAQTQHAYQTKC